jgi:hypothetical protein
MNGVDENNVRHEASRHFRNKKREYLKNKINELAMNSKNKNIRYLCRRINEFKRGCRLRSNLLKDENGALLCRLPQRSGRTNSNSRKNITVLNPCTQEKEDYLPGQ